MVRKHRLLEGQALPDGTLYGGLAAAEPKDLVVRKLADGTYQMEEVIGATTTVPLVPLSAQLLATIRKLDETAEGALTFDGQPISTAAPVSIAFDPLPDAAAIRADIGTIYADETPATVLSRVTPIHLGVAATSEGDPATITASLVASTTATTALAELTEAATNFYLRVTATADGVPDKIAHALINLVVQPARVALSGLEDGTAEITVDPTGTTATITIADTVIYDGTYVVTLADLDAGAVNLVPASISGMAAVGATLTAVPGLWIYASGQTVPVIAGEWPDGSTASTYVVLEADAGTGVDYDETATNDAGERSVSSNAIAIPAVSLLDFHDPNEPGLTFNNGMSHDTNDDLIWTIPPEGTSPQVNITVPEGFPAAGTLIRFTADVTAVGFREVNFRAVGRGISQSVGAPGAAGVSTTTTLTTTMTIQSGTVPGDSWWLKVNAPLTPGSVGRIANVRFELVA